MKNEGSTAILQLLMRPISAGTTSLPPDNKRSVMILNAMSLVLIMLVVGVGSYFYILRPSPFFKIGIPIESLSFLGVIWLNKKQQFFNANLLMLSTNAIFIAYWSIILGTGISVELLLAFITVIIFHLGSAFIVYQRSTSLLIGIIGCMAIGGWMIANSIYHYIIPISISQDITVIMRWSTTIVLLLFILAVLFSYTAQIHSLLKESRRHKDASEQKSIFLSDVFHEVRTPLNVIFSITQLLELRKNEFPEIKKEIGQLFSSCDIAHSIINHVLDHARIESGNFHNIKLETLSLKDCISHCISAHQYNAASRNIEIKLDFDPQLELPILSDAIVLMKIFNNLLSNATKFANSNSIIHFSCLKIDKNTLLFEVTNDGIIDPDIALRMFNRFVTKREQKVGTGLGLAIIKHLIELMQGKIYVKQSDTKTITIAVELPYTQGTGSINASSGFDFMKNCFVGSKIMIIDDDKSITRYLSMFLKEMGIEVQVYNNPKVALDNLTEYKPNLIISDLNMPVLRGDELILHLRNQGKGIPVLIVTGDAFKRETILAQGAAGFITKPILLRELQAELGKHLPYAIYS